MILRRPSGLLSLLFFFSGTAVEVTPIREVDGRGIGDGKPGPITRRIQETFNQAVRGQLPQYRRWLSFTRRSTEREGGFVGQAVRA